MLRHWQSLVNRGVDDAVPPNETRYIVATNVVALLGLVTVVPYVVLGLMLDLSATVLWVAMFVTLGYSLVLGLNHRRLHHAASVWLGICSMCAFGAAYLLFGSGFYVYFLLVTALTPLCYRPRTTTRWTIIISSVCLFVVAALHSIQHAPPFDIGDSTMWQVGNLLGMAFVLAGATLYADAVAHRTEVELHNAQAQLIEAEKSAAMTRLVAGILHEVNTPLGAIRSSSDTIKTAMGKASEALKAQDDTKERKRGLRSLKAGMALGDTIDAAVLRIASTVEGLERFVNLDRAEMADVDVRSSLDDAIAILGRPVERDYDDDLPHVRCAPSRLNHVVLELLQNAINAVGDHGHVRASAHLAGTHIVVEIADDGTGVPEEELAHIFDIGFSRRGGRVAMRLGLPMAKRNVEEVGGTLTIESSPDDGTTVRASFPTADAT